MALLLYCSFAIAQTGYIGWNVYQQQQQSTDTSLWLINANESLENKSIDGRSSVELGDNILGFGLKGISNTYAGLNPFNRAFSFVGDISATTGDLTDTLTARIGVSLPTDNITSILNANTNKLELEFEGGIIYNKLKLDNDGFSFNTTKDVLFNASEMTIDNVSSYFLSASQVKQSARCLRHSCPPHAAPADPSNSRDSRAAGPKHCPTADRARTPDAPRRARDPRQDAPAVSRYRRDRCPPHRADSANWASRAGWRWFARLWFRRLLLFHLRLR